MSNFALDLGLRANSTAFSTPARQPGRKPVRLSRESSPPVKDTSVTMASAEAGTRRRRHKGMEQSVYFTEGDCLLFLQIDVRCTVVHSVHSRLLGQQKYFDRACCVITPLAVLQIAHFAEC